jgi:hypothetical protein
MLTSDPHSCFVAHFFFDFDFYAAILVSDVLRIDESAAQLKNRLAYYLTKHYPQNFKHINIKNVQGFSEGKHHLP